MIKYTDCQLTTSLRYHSDCEVNCKTEKYIQHVWEFLQLSSYETNIYLFDETYACCFSLVGNTHEKRTNMPTTQY